MTTTTEYVQSTALTDEEKAKVRNLLGREPTPVELQIFDILWSEHCSYKSSRTALKTLPVEGPTVLMGPGEDAGILRFAEHEGKKYAVVVAHESHNHPSQVVPLEGAATGIGGIVRDVVCMGAEVIGVLDPLRFGDPKGEHAYRSIDIARGVVKGIAMYANALGVPNLGGDVRFDPSYDDNCLVNVVALGLVREDHVIRSAVPEERKEPYVFILIGKPTDSTGFGGATLASAVLDDADVEENKGAVQVADPFLKRVLNVALYDLFERAREKGVAIGCKDLGAGGISCMASELADRGGMGVELDYDAIPLAEDQDLPPWVALVSETQERYGLAVPESFAQETLALFNERYELPSIYRGARAAVVGRFTEERRVKVTRGGEVLCDAGVEAITCGVLESREGKAPAVAREEIPAPYLGDPGEALLRMLASPNGGSAEPIYRSYDTEVQARAVIRPGEGDSTVILPVPGCAVGLASTVDGNPWYGLLDPRAAGALAVVEGARNLAAVGAEPIGMTDCLNYGNPEDPAVFHQFTEGVRGIREGAEGIGLRDRPEFPIPIVSGNVSFYNQSSRGRAIAPSPILCLLGRIEDASRAATLGLKKTGSRILLVGERYDDLGGSLFAREVLGLLGARPPRIRYEQERGAIHGVSRLVGEGRVRAAHDIGEGGFLVALAEMVDGARDRSAGAAVAIDAFGRELGVAERLFSESGGFLLEVPLEGQGTVMARLRMAGVPVFPVGETTADGRLTVRREGEVVLLLERDRIGGARRGALSPFFTGV
ncbi:MAG: phosphoribosylformylglycinamidine synthase subunit PurL [Candidatus Eisenbacteria bacterium]